jgi:hypothetical protein
MSVNNDTEDNRQVDQQGQQVVALEVSHIFANFFDNYLEDNSVLLHNNGWAILSIKVNDGTGVLELDKYVKNIKFLLDLDVQLVENFNDKPRDVKLKKVTYELSSISHETSFLSEITPKSHDFDSD